MSPGIYTGNTNGSIKFECVNSELVDPFYESSICDNVKFERVFGDTCNILLYQNETTVPFDVYAEV